MKNKKILITGGLGFVFHHAVEKYSQENEIIVIDNLSDGSDVSLQDKWKNNKNIKVVIGDINEIYDLLGDDDFDIIINAAAESCVDKSIENQSVFLKSNVLGTHAMLEWARKQNKLEKFVQISTDEVLGSSEKYCDIEDKLNPSSPYSSSKAGSECLCNAWRETYQLPIMIVRFCNIIGKGQATTKLLPRLIDCIKNNKPFGLMDGGHQTREYLDVRNACTLLERSIDHGKDKIYQLTFNQEYSTIQMIKEVEKVFDKKIVTYETIRKGHDQHYRITAHKIVDTINSYHTIYTIKDTIQWMI